MSPRNFGFQGKRPDQVTFSELVGGLGLAIVVLYLIGRWLLSLGGL